MSERRLSALTKSAPGEGLSKSRWIEVQPRPVCDPEMRLTSNPWIPRKTRGRAVITDQYGNTRFDEWTPYIPTARVVQAQRVTNQLGATTPASEPPHSTVARPAGVGSPLLRGREFLHALSRFFPFRRIR